MCSPDPSDLGNAWCTELRWDELRAGFTRTLIDFEKRTTGTSTVTWSSTDGLRLIG